MDGPEGLSAVVFDFDGTLFDLAVEWEPLKRRLARFSRHTTLGEDLQAWMASHNTEALEAVREAELHGARNGDWLAGAAEALVAISASVQVGIFTRNSRHAVTYAIGRLGDPPRVMVVGREDVRRLKPDAEGLSRFLHKWSLQPEQVLMVGDTNHDIEAARRLGLPVAIVDNPRLEKSPPDADYYLDNLSELPALIRRLTYAKPSR